LNFGPSIDKKLGPPTGRKASGQVQGRRGWLGEAQEVASFRSTLKMATGKIRADMGLINPHPQAKTRARNPLRA